MTVFLLMINIFMLKLNLLKEKNEPLVINAGDKSIALIEEAELILYVLDNNEPLTPEDSQLLELTKHKNRIVIINKIDLGNKVNHIYENSVSVLNRPFFVR